MSGKAKQLRIKVVNHKCRQKVWIVRASGKGTGCFFVANRVAGIQKFNQ